MHTACEYIRNTSHLDRVRIHVVHDVEPVGALIGFPVGHIFQAHRKGLVHGGGEVELVVACTRMAWQARGSGWAMPTPLSCGRTVDLIPGHAGVSLVRAGVKGLSSQWPVRAWQGQGPEMARP